MKSVVNWIKFEIKVYLKISWIFKVVYGDKFSQFLKIQKLNQIIFFETTKIVTLIQLPIIYIIYI